MTSSSKTKYSAKLRRFRYKRPTLFSAFRLVFWYISIVAITSLYVKFDRSGDIKVAAYKQKYRREAWVKRWITGCGYERLHTVVEGWILWGKTPAVAATVLEVGKVS